MKRFFKNIESSLDDHNHKEGFSSRKLSAFVIMICILSAHIAWLWYAINKSDFGLLIPVLTIDFGFIVTALALTTYSKSKEKKSELTNK